MKTYIVTEKDIERLRVNLNSNGDYDYWYISQLDNWEETLISQEEWKSILQEIKDDSKYKPREDSPRFIDLEVYWKHGKVSTLREALPYDHEENLWNWFRRTYPDLNPEYYDIYKPTKTHTAEK